MLPEQIKAMRLGLGLTQEQLSIILGVNKASIVRYESGQAVPTGTIKQKIGILGNIAENPEHKKKILGSASSGEGVSVVAALLTFLVTMSPVTGAVIGISAMLSSPAGKKLRDILNSYTHKGE